DNLFLIGSAKTDFILLNSKREFSVTVLNRKMDCFAKFARDINQQVTMFQFLYFQTGFMG
ncbi:MAG: hypothetical protein EZS28_029241, partial [Streblomastix strix]